MVINTLLNHWLHPCKKKKTLALLITETLHFKNTYLSVNYVTLLDTKLHVIYIKQQLHNFSIQDVDEFVFYQNRFGEM